MWHQSRANEKRVKGLIVDHKKRAERRRQRIAQFQSDPFQHLRVNGSAMTLNINPSEREKVESGSHLVAWQTDGNVMIDRFDVRIHLDFMREPKTTLLAKEAEDPDALDLRNFERYRDLIHAERLGVGEALHLSSIAFHDDERNEKNKHISYSRPLPKSTGDSGTGKPVRKATIAFDYGGLGGGHIGEPENVVTGTKEESFPNDKNAVSDISEVDNPEVFDIVAKTEMYNNILTDEERSEANRIARERYNVQNYMRRLRKENEELERIKAENAGVGTGKVGCESKTSKPLDRDRRNLGVGISSTDITPSYAQRESPKYKANLGDTSGSGSASDNDNETKGPRSTVSINGLSGEPKRNKSTRHDEERLRTTESYRSAGSSMPKGSRASFLSNTVAAPPKKLTALEKMKLKRQKRLEQNFNADKKKEEEKERETKMIKRSREGRITYRRSLSPDPYTSSRRRGRYVNVRSRDLAAVAGAGAQVKVFVAVAVLVAVAVAVVVAVVVAVAVAVAVAIGAALVVAAVAAAEVTAVVVVSAAAVVVAVAAAVEVEVPLAAKVVVVVAVQQVEIKAGVQKDKTTHHMNVRDGMHAQLNGSIGDVVGVDLEEGEGV
eukprot:CFRG7056T1